MTDPMAQDNLAPYLFSIALDSMANYITTIYILYYYNNIYYITTIICIILYYYNSIYYIILLQ